VVAISPQLDRIAWRIGRFKSDFTFPKVWEYRHQTGTSGGAPVYKYSDRVGAAQRLENGNMIVWFGADINPTTLVPKSPQTYTLVEADASPEAGAVAVLDVHGLCCGTHEGGSGCCSPRRTHPRSPPKAGASTPVRGREDGFKGDKTGVDAARLFKIHPATDSRLLAWWISTPPTIASPLTSHHRSVGPRLRRCQSGLRRPTRRRPPQTPRGSRCSPPVGQASWPVHSCPSDTLPGTEAPASAMAVPIRRQKQCRG
jgi:hypothetical protein